MPTPAPQTVWRSWPQLAATAILACGIAAIAWAGAATAATAVQPTEWGLTGLLVLAAVGCSRVPLRIGMGDTVISLDSIPLVLAVVLLPPPLAVLLGAATATSSLVGQPHLPGAIGWYWRVQTVASTALVMGLVGVGFNLVAGDPAPGAVLFVPALLAALVLELGFDMLVVVELMASGQGGWRSLAQTRIVIAANVLLPAIATAVLTPYLEVSDWWFGMLLPLLLVTMYGALWIANSQQLHKRRGDHLKSTFSRYVPDGIVDDNLDTMQRVELGGEQHDVSVLFCDVRGFTAWAEGKPAAEVITELNVLLSELSASVMSTGGTLDKFTGDGLMAFWGAPVQMDDHAERACHAALDMLERLEMVNERRHAAGHQPFSIGIGVHAGPAVIGNVGHERRLDYTAIGDTVNTAARVEAATKDMGATVLVTTAVHDLLSSGVRGQAVAMGSVRVKGRTEAVEVWRLE